ncbi:MAG: transposase [Lysobacteraceae bacterium]|nr:MAG: transposase [Xanthomonadaceae bacterium]
MGYARSHTIEPGEPGAFHLICRCVRRAFLCGKDATTGANYDHRKAWIERRIIELAKYFAIDVYAYAVMSNHYHVVVWSDPKRVKAWSDEEVARRWVRLFPPVVNGEVKEGMFPLAEERLLSAPERIRVLRERLGSVSWFMRLINEPMARRANKEDCVSGRFWESRFKSHALLDQAALVSCMAYVDLNPVRAAITDRIEQSDHTSIKKRVDELEAITEEVERKAMAGRSLLPIGQKKGQEESLAMMRVDHYIALVEWTGRVLRNDKRGFIPPTVTPVLEQLGIEQASWRSMVMRYRDSGWAFGAMQSLLDCAERIGKHWLQGLRKDIIEISPPISLRRLR